MKLLITGANGFLGRHVVANALHNGHKVRAVVRPASCTNKCVWIDDPSVELARADFRSPMGLAEVLDGVDAVLHLAASKSGSFYSQFANTVVATENLINAMSKVGLNRLILIGTFSIYDYRAVPIGSTLTEDAPIEDEPDRRDDYCRSKLAQENMVRRMADKIGINLTLLRPGVIYGPGNLWGARIGTSMGANRWLRFGANAQMPMIYVENCAAAIILAAEREKAHGQTINLVDNNPPTQSSYLRCLRRYVRPFPKIIPINYTLMRMLVDFSDVINGAFFHRRAKLPQILRPLAFEARFRPLRYSNERAKRILGWDSRIGLDEGIRRSVQADEDMPVAPVVCRVGPIDALNPEAQPCA